MATTGAEDNPRKMVLASGPVTLHSLGLAEGSKAQCKVGIFPRTPISLCVCVSCVCMWYMCVSVVYVFACGVCAYMHM